jgi:hypothetical protein
MLYRTLDADGDYTLGRGRQGFLSGAAAVGQAVKTRLKLLLGEWWEDRENGLPLFQSIAGARAADPKIKENIDTIIRDRILSTIGVSSIASYSSTFDRTGRKYSVTAVVNTFYGQTPMEVDF